MRNTLRLPLLALMLVPACAHTPVYKSSGPSIGDGVKVAIVGQSCDQYHDPNFEFDDFVGLDLDLEVRNATDAPLTVHRDMIRVVASDGIAPRTQTWKAVEPIQVEAGGVQRISVRYMTLGSLECRGPLDLDLKNAVTRGVPHWLWRPSISSHATESISALPIQGSTAIEDPLAARVPG